jgi:hypothetical protein
MSPVDGDDSRGFAAVEREHLRRHWLPDFEWVTYPEASPRNRPPVPLVEARIGLVDTCGAHRVDQLPVGSSGRAALVPLGAEITFTHPGYDVARAEKDHDVVHPARTLQRLAEQGVIGSVASTAVSVMGGVLIGRRIVERAVPTAVETMLRQDVDLALLVPA